MIREHRFECVERDDCETSALKDGHAHLVTLEAGLLYENMKSFNARPILAETYTNDGMIANGGCTRYVPGTSGWTDTYRRVRGENAHR